MPTRQAAAHSKHGSISEVQVSKNGPEWFRTTDLSRVKRQPIHLLGLVSASISQKRPMPDFVNGPIWPQLGGDWANDWASGLVRRRSPDVSWFPARSRLSLGGSSIAIREILPAAPRSPWDVCPMHGSGIQPGPKGLLR
jgi:hypothetical protein